MRKLTLRERVLLVLLAVVAVVSAYVLLFSMPLTQRMEELAAQMEQDQELNLQLEQRVQNMERMQQEVRQLTDSGTAPVPMPLYDNLTAVMVELNDILAGCSEYSLSFQGTLGENQVYQRQVSIPFICNSYEEAKSIVQQLHDCGLRCVLQGVDLSTQEDGTVQAVATVVFLEYDQSAPAATTEETDDTAA